MQFSVKLDPRNSSSLQSQLFESIRQLILNGQLKAGASTPSTRELSTQLGVSRNTVILTYDRLIAEGYLDSKPTVGTFVTTALPEGSLYLERTSEQQRQKSQAMRHPVQFSGRAPSVVNPNRYKLAVDFWVGRPDPHSFPSKAWRRSLIHNLNTAGANITEYRNPAGILELRSAIADHLGPTRGMNVKPEQVIITNGCQGALNLIARLLIKEGTSVVTECPCYQGAAFLFESYGARLNQVPVDDKGLDTSKLPSDPTGLAYVTPSHQYPMGSTLSLDRRIKLLDWAWENGAYIVEDDYDSDFRYKGSPLTALAGLDKYGCVFYMGTFSKSIGAGIRLGYLIVPHELVEAASTAKALMDNGHAWLDQATLADFISSGSFARHLRTIRHTYLQRRDCLMEELYRHFGNIHLSGIDGGMHLIWHLPSNSPTAAEVQSIAESVGVGVYCLESGAAYCNCNDDYNIHSLMLGYSSVSRRMIKKGVGLLSKNANFLG